MKKRKICLLFIMIFAFLTLCFAPYYKGKALDIAPWFYEDGTLYINYVGDMPDFNSSDETPWIGYGISGVKKIFVGEYTTGIGNNAFSGYTDLESVELTAGLKLIGENAFEGCGMLKEITVPDGATTIGKNAFKNCTSLETINLPDSITSIGASAFDYTSLVYYNDGLDLYIGNHLIKVLDHFEEYEVKAGTVCIADETFKDHDNLKKVTFSDVYDPSAGIFGQSTLVSIGKSAFEGCVELTYIDLPHTVISIGERAFCNCTALKTEKIPASVSFIGDEAFASVPELTIRCFGDSYVEEYAKSNLISYKVFSSAPVFSDDSLYKMNSRMIFGIAPGTEYSIFLSNILSAVDVYDREGHIVKNGNICTGYNLSTDPGNPRLPRMGFTISVKGDTDGNGKIDATDYITVKRHILSISKFESDSAFYMAADIDGNAKIDATDYIAIKRHILGISLLTDGSEASGEQIVLPPDGVEYN